MTQHTLALDIGGTKFSIAVFDDGRMVARETRSTDRAGGPTPVTGRVVEREFVDPTPVNRSPTDAPGGLTPHTSDLSRQDEDITVERRPG